MAFSKAGAGGMLENAVRHPLFSFLDQRVLIRAVAEVAKTFERVVIVQRP